MTDAERLALIERHKHHLETPGDTAESFLLSMARRALAAEEKLAILLQDLGADDTAQSRRDWLIREEGARMASAECAAIAKTNYEQCKVALAQADGRLERIAAHGRLTGASSVLQAIRAKFALNGGRAITQAVAEDIIKAIMGGSFLHDKAPTAMFAKEVCAMIRARFGLTS